MRTSGDVKGHQLLPGSDKTLKCWIDAWLLEWIWWGKQTKMQAEVLLVSGLSTQKNKIHILFYMGLQFLKKQICSLRMLLDTSLTLDTMIASMGWSIFHYFTLKANVPAVGPTWTEQQLLIIMSCLDYCNIWYGELPLKLSTK